MGLERKIDGKFDTLTRSIYILIIVALPVAVSRFGLTAMNERRKAPCGAREGRMPSLQGAPTSNGLWKEGTPPPPSAASPSGGKAFCLP